MILDGRRSDVDLNRSASVVIVGAGPAGLTLAQELGVMYDILVVESGGLDTDKHLDTLNTGTNGGIPYPLVETRTRQFGGSTALWAGYCAIFDKSDFDVRSWVADSGWPIDFDELQSYSQQVSEKLNMISNDFNAQHLASSVNVKLPFIHKNILQSAWRFGDPTLRISDQQRDNYNKYISRTILTNTNVVDIRLDPQNRNVDRIVVQTFEGKRGVIQADIFVLACGGLEIPRILLNAESQLCLGVANTSGLVGCYFSEHPHISITTLKLHNLENFQYWTDKGINERGIQFMFSAGLSEATQARNHLLNARAHIYRTPNMAMSESPKVGLFLEQAPNPDSSVTLSETRDVLGLKKLHLNWQLTEQDWASYIKTADLISKHFVDIGAATIDPQNLLPYHDSSAVLYSNHHLGTTRMSADPLKGVVDADCRTHDHKNLYIVGGSVFPTVSWANPTFTVLSLVLRLAEHLKSRLGSTR